MANILYLGASDSISYTGTNGKVIVGGTSGNSKFTVVNGDIECNDSGRGIILKDSNNVRWKIVVNTDGSLGTVSA